ncbi:MAG TPA: 2'-5' RNA ligase family protein [Flavisolibacter sp.]|nr:2'-5' RNA ligase family protein [Flavisolibacter sp.]
MSLVNGAAVFYPTEQLWEYLLVARPDEDFNQLIAEEKKNFNEVYGESSATRNPPYITIANFLAKEAMEVTLSRWIRNICQLQPRFTVTFNNYSGFPPHTIYLRIQDPAPFNELANRLKIIDSFARSNDCPPVHLSAKPHLALACSLPDHIYDKAVADYAQRSFSGAFRVDRLVLVKRSWAGGDFQLADHFMLGPA